MTYYLISLIYWLLFRSSSHCLINFSVICIYFYSCFILIISPNRYTDATMHRPGGGYDGRESEDSTDSFIDDGEEEDWRVAMRQITGESICLIDLLIYQIDIY